MASNQPAERRRKIESLYHAARARPAADRAAFLAQVCDGDENLRREVESLLAQPVSAQGVLDGTALGAASNTIGASDGATLIGSRLGAYHVLAPLGAGGMGEVYRARDTRLGRDVAIKILPRAYTADPARLARLDREARVLAALNHPNIASIYGLEEFEGTRALVLELVEGETLAERIADHPERPLLLTESLAIARQIADALDVAHEKGIVHRDLKPANIKITPQGTVKLLDFGLAKLEPGEADHTALPTVTIDATREGVVLGTAAYMSPEQARGQSVDKRTDIWAFGCVLYEMLTGRAAFARATVTDTLAAVFERAPDWALLPGAASPRLRHVLRRCLEKDPKQRARDIADVRAELDEAADPGLEIAGGQDLEGGRRGISRMLVAVGLITVA